MEVYFTRLGGEQLHSPTLEQVVGAAQETGIASIQERLDQGAALAPSVEKSWELLPTRIEKALRRFHKEQPLPADWHTFQPELVFPDHGQCRVDLLHQSALGPCITDFKTKVTAAEYIVDSFLFDAETSWQMAHYVWAAREMGIRVDSFAICLIVIEPFHVYLEQWPIDEVNQTRWLVDAKNWWKLMELTETGIVAPMRVGDHRDKYGLCSMHSLCYGESYHMYTRKDRDGHIK
jgi:hypothetical protein